MIPKIRKDTLDFILEAARNAHPREFIGLLRVDSAGIISEILVIPGSEFDFGRSSMRPHMVPLDPSIAGSVHSHPAGSSGKPSKEDLNFFSKQGAIHIIAVYPFTYNDVCVFDSYGRQLDFKIL